MSKTNQFKKILIANRGEIAIRIARSVFELGIQSVGVYSHEDRFSLHRYKTDESYKIGTQGLPLEAYLNIDEIVELAKKTGADAIHPGYGFLSENSLFAKACIDAGIVFIGPSEHVLNCFGDKVSARKIAKEAGLQIIPGTLEPVADLEEAKNICKDISYPVTLKAVSGGGGKGIRTVHSENELEEAFARTRSEANVSFGQSSVYIEKTIVSPRHIEVQVLGDSHGQLVHLFERDCSIQRRNQKVVEVAPAAGLDDQTRQSLYEQALSICKHVNYQGVGTVEFLVSPENEVYFLEVNPRIQVEHTVTEMITGVDLIQASILVASGAALSDDSIGISSQSDIKQQGAAIQCRVTTEDPLNNFAPDTGRIIAYRPSAGFGVRLDEGHGTSGGIVTPYYDSLLVKVTAWSSDLKRASAKMYRSLSEFRIRGVKHNIPLLKNIVQHKLFLSSDISTDFFANNQDLFNYVVPKDRATKLLKYLAEVTVNNPHGFKKKERPQAARYEQTDFSDDPSIQTLPTEQTAKSVFVKDGVTGLVEWIKGSNKLLLTDTTMRDAHQSLLATRLRTKDILEIAPFYDQFARQFFSLEVWGGATFDTSFRFLKEDPWQRLAKIREAIPNVMLQMLLRGDNAVGYTNYPSWVVKNFISETVASGLDIFRIFDCLNQADKMKVALEEVKKQGAIAEVSIAYTGDLTDPSKTKYDLKYYLKLAKELESMGTDILCIKDMAGLLKPKAASTLIRALKQETNLPIHLHTHDTSGVGVAMLLEAARAGCDIVDGAISSLSGLTSQPSLNSITASLSGEDLCPDLDLSVLNELGRYWEGIRGTYSMFEPGLNATSTDVYRHEIPGGQYSNLFEQAKSVGLNIAEFKDLTTRYTEVNQLLGDIIKVTPSSKVVGDMALLLHKQNLTADQLMSQRPQLDYPDSVLSFLKGHMGVPYQGFNEEFRSMVLGEDVPLSAPSHEQAHLDCNYEQIASHLKTRMTQEPDERDILSSGLYPKVFDDYLKHCDEFGKVTTELPTPVFFFGLEQDEEIAVDIERGKTLIISLKGISECDADGKRKVFFKLNGFSREIEILDTELSKDLVTRPKADATNQAHVAAPMPGKIIEVLATVGSEVKKGDALFVTEAMKMEYTVTARESGVISELYAGLNDLVEAGDLLGVLA